MQRFVVIGRRASASPGFSLLDLPASSGRLDVLLRCLRAALMVSHGLRLDTVIYLVLLGGPRAPRALRFRGAEARFLRPDERSLAILVQRALEKTAPGPGFADARAGIALAEGGLDAVIEDLGPATPYVLEEGAPDLRDDPLEGPEPAFFLGDHLGLDEAARARLASLGARPIGLGPVSLHAEDAITIVHNELDRRALLLREIALPSPDLRSPAR